jgi:hypothetical protein
MVFFPSSFPSRTLYAFLISPVQPHLTLHPAPGRNTAATYFMYLLLHIIPGGGTFHLREWGCMMSCLRDTHLVLTQCWITWYFHTASRNSYIHVIYFSHGQHTGYSLVGFMANIWKHSSTPVEKLPMFTGRYAIKGSHIIFQYKPTHETVVPFLIHNTAILLMVNTLDICKRKP